MKRLIYLLLIPAITACTKSYDIPSQYTDVAEQAPIYPDYRDIVVPENIAPLNFMVKDAKGLVAVFEGENGSCLTASGEDRIDIDSAEWRKMLTAERGKDILVTVYADMDGWKRYASHTLTVAEPIDSYLSYRLIEPGYELYRQLGLYQRNLENFTQNAIYENNRAYEDDNNHCINCHNFQNYDTGHMLFHVRAQHGGTIMIDGDKCRKIQIKSPDILAAGVYPTWHPKMNMVAFSTNKTGQVFHVYHKEKIEVVDEASDLILYDVDRNEVRNIIAGPDFETFPCWNPAGDKLYFCSAHVRQMDNVPDSMAAEVISHYYDSVYYDLKCMTFDQKTLKFGKPETVIQASASHKSISVPRLSPDGRYILFTLGDYGQFHIWHKSSDLWVMDLEKDSVYALRDANSPDVDSYHTWSGNGRWIVFASRRMDGNYTRAFIAYFDRNGKAHKAFCIPQRDPEHNILLLKSYNVPELTKNAVKVTPETLRKCIYETDGDTARFTGNIRHRVDGHTGASPQLDGRTGASPKSGN
ncbi:MAG: PD40 domain-containing protein [Bacteroidaceae bacterium]|nr:PD40 domain-containing protein [Bacteroidaceae bacterium]